MKSISEKELQRRIDLHKLWRQSKESGERLILNGSVYEGECACLVGTIAKCRHESVEDLTIDLVPDSSRLAEMWFLGINEGDLPQSNQKTRDLTE